MPNFQVFFFQNEHASRQHNSTITRQNKKLLLPQIYRPFDMGVKCWGTEAKDITKIAAFAMKCFKCTAEYKRMIRHIE